MAKYSDIYKTTDDGARETLSTWVSTNPERNHSCLRVPRVVGEPIKSSASYRFLEPCYKAAMRL
jgi:hypothetical protein